MSLNKNKINVLVIDSQITFRDTLSDIINSSKDMVLDGTAPTGFIGINKLREMESNVVLLDVNIIDYNIENFTKDVLDKYSDCGIILTSKKGTSPEKLNEAILALEYGAFDIFEKPDVKCLKENEFLSVKRKLQLKIREFSIKKYSKMAIEASGVSQAEKKDKIESMLSKYTDKTFSQYKAVLLGVSTGGPRALSQIIPQLPENFPVPIVIVIHLPELFTESMAKELNRKSKIKVVEAKEGEQLLNSTVYIARGGKHLVLDKRNDNNIRFVYDDGPPINNCKPSVDALFQSGSEIFGMNSIGIILTGMGNDGANGLKKLKNKGAFTIVQDRETSVVWGMPGSAVNLNCVDKVLPLENIIYEVLEII